MICRTGRNRCFIDIESSVAKVSIEGKIWRDLCPACRFQQCQRIKQGSKEDDKKTVEKPGTLALTSSSTIEQDMANTVGAAIELVWRMKCMPTRTRQTCFKSTTEPLAIYLNSMKEQICHVKAYATFFPGFRKLNVKDRTLVFMATQFRVIAGEGCIYNDDFYIASTSSSSFKRVTAIVDGLDDVYERGYQLWKFIQSINFSQAEIGFYLAFLFFNGLFLIK